MASQATAGGQAATGASLRRARRVEASASCAVRPAHAGTYSRTSKPNSRSTLASQCGAALLSRPTQEEDGHCERRLLREAERETDGRKHHAAQTAQHRAQRLTGGKGGRGR
jgi:hypothetical protein